MFRQIELSSLDLRYESYRMRNPAQEGELLASISVRGIESALEGVDAGERHLLLNGFKRYRCARKLGIGTVPYLSLGEDEAMGLLSLLRVWSRKPLGVLEAARFIEELQRVHGMSLAEIAEAVGRTKSWVCMRVKLLEGMTEAVRDKLFQGAFSDYAYMSVVRPFMRMNGVSKRDLEEFVVALSGRKLSVREIQLLADGFFRGPDSFREEIRKGNVAAPQEWLRQVPEDPDGCSDFERSLLRDLGITQKYMQRAMGKSQDPRLQSRTFMAEANLLTTQILSRSTAFFHTLRELHDRSGQA